MSIGRSGPAEPAGAKGSSAVCAAAADGSSGRRPGATVESEAMGEHRLPEPDRPWVMRTYAGHSTARESNERYRQLVANGTGGLSVMTQLADSSVFDADGSALVIHAGPMGTAGLSFLRNA